VLALQGDLSATGGWTLSKQTTAASSADQFSGAEHSLRPSKRAQAGTPAMCVTLDNPCDPFSSETATCLLAVN
jgi:hypothetical protein